VEEAAKEKRKFIPHTIAEIERWGHRHVD